MAIIKGMKTADVGEITPYNEDIEKLAAGITAREGRAEATRNAIADAKNQMLLKETRDNTDDMELAQQLERGFTSDVDAMLNQADYDYSTISKGDLQRLAGDYMGKTEWKALTNAKIQTDIYNDEMRKLQAKGKTPFVLGTDPNTVSLYDEKGNINHLTNTFQVQELYDHSKAAKALFNTIGKEIHKRAGWDNKLAVGSPAWMARYRTWIYETTSNKENVDKIINNGLTGFLTDPSGKQYYDIFYQKQTNEGIEHDEADEYAKEKVRALIRTYGISEYDKTTVDTFAYDKTNVPGSGSGSGTKTPGAVDKEEKPDVISTTTTVSYQGATHSTGEGVDAIDVYKNNTSDTDYSQISRAADFDISQTTNNNTLVEVVDAVESPNDPTGEGSGSEGIIYKAGVLYKMGRSQGASNPTVFSIKTIKNTTSEISNITDSITTKKNELKKDPNNETLKQELKTLTQNLFNAKLHLANKKNYNNLDPTILKNYSPKDIANVAGDDLFTREDINELLTNDDDILKGASKLSSQVYKSIIDTDPSNPWKSGAISTFKTIQNKDELNININPILPKLQDKYESDLEAIYMKDVDGNKIEDPNGDGYVLIATSSKNEEKLLQAKVFKIKQKIELANKFLIDQNAAVENIKSVYNRNFTRNKNLRTFLDAAALQAGITKDEISKGLHLKLPEVKDENDKLITTYGGKLEHGAIQAERASGISWVPIKVAGGYKNLYDAFEYTKQSIKNDYIEFAKADKAYIDNRGPLKIDPNTGNEIQPTEAANLANSAYQQYKIAKRKIEKYGTEDEALKTIQKIKDAHNIFKSNILNGKYTQEDIKNTEWYKTWKDSDYVKNNNLKLEDINSEWFPRGSLFNTLKDLNIELLENEFKDSNLYNIVSEGSQAAELMKTLTSYTQAGGNSGLGAAGGEHIGQVSYFDPNTKTYALTPETKEKLYENREKQLKEIYGSDSRMQEYFIAVDKMSRQINRTSEYYLFQDGADGEGKNYYKGVKNAIVTAYGDPGSKIRRVIYDNSDNSEIKEDLNKGTINTIIKNEFKGLTDANQKAEGGFSQYKKNWLTRNLTGIRLDYTNPTGSAFVAQWDYYDGSGTPKSFEMNTTAISEKNATEYFGIEGMKMKYVSYLKEGLEKTGGSWADLPTLGGGKPIRISQATGDFSAVDVQGNSIKRGTFYIMSKSDKLYNAAEETGDPDEGSTKYGIENTKLKYHPFNTMDEIFTFVKDKNKKLMNDINELLRAKAALQNPKWRNYTVTQILGTTEDGKDHPFSKYGNKEAAIKGLDAEIEFRITGKEPAKTETEVEVEVETKGETKEEAGNF